jgi:hypothetical protein
MPSPFPGIDPFLESQHFWEDFHPSFLTYCRDALNEILPEAYVAQLGERIRLVELSHKAAKLVRPGIAVIAGTFHQFPFPSWRPRLIFHLISPRYSPPPMKEAGILV